MTPLELAAARRARVGRVSRLAAGADSDEQNRLSRAVERNVGAWSSRRERGSSDLDVPVSVAVGVELAPHDGARLVLTEALRPTAAGARSRLANPRDDRIFKRREPFRLGGRLVVAADGLQVGGLARGRIGGEPGYG